MREKLGKSVKTVSFIDNRILNRTSWIIDVSDL